MPRPVEELVRIAVRDNAAWCAAIARHHGIGSEVADGLWRAHASTPDGYPEAVTMAPSLAAGDVLAALPDGATSVKDSFADVDLASAGFRIGFGAEWVAIEPDAEARTTAPVELAPLERVRTPQLLEAWRRAHGDAGAFVPSLLEDPDVVVLAAKGSAGVVAGAVLHDGGDAVGVSNVFGPAAAVYRAVVAVVREDLGGRPLVGWEARGDLDGPLDAGFTAVGPLRVWMR